MNEGMSDWSDLKRKMFKRFWPLQEGALCTHFLAVKQEDKVADYRHQFKEQTAPLQHLTDELLEKFLH